VVTSAKIGVIKFSNSSKSIPLSLFFLVKFKLLTLLWTSLSFSKP
jgi:hypothetical protein